MLRQYLQNIHGGHIAHKKDSSKALRNYKRIASEYITFLAKEGIRRKDYRMLWFGRRVVVICGIALTNNLSRVDFRKVPC